MALLLLVVVMVIVIVAADNNNIKTSEKSASSLRIKNLRTIFFWRTVLEKLRQRRQ